MHIIEPFFLWRDEYMAEDDPGSPFYGTSYNETSYVNKVYNYYIHPQWHDFGSNTLYLKVLYVDYDAQYAIIEFIGEWNDAIENDIMYLKREVIDSMIRNGIYRFILLCEHVFNYHSDDDSYYEEWWEDIRDDEGWICMVNTFDHVVEELRGAKLHHFMHFGKALNHASWRKLKPADLHDLLDAFVNGQIKRLPGA